MKRSYAAVVILLLAVSSFSSRFLWAEEKDNGKYQEKGSKFFFRGAFSSLTSSRGNEPFTDTNGANGTFNGKKGGFLVGGGVALGLTKPEYIAGIASLIGQIDVEYSRFSNQLVRQTTSALTGGTANSRVNVAELNVGIGPKIRFDTLGRFKPFFMPIGLAFLIPGPPSNDSTYLDLGLNFGAGVDFMITQWFSLGLDGRYTHSFKLTHTPTSYYSLGGGFGIHF
jgi:hypothetical protein